MALYLTSYIYKLLCIINRNLDFIELAQKTVKWQALANMVINIWIPEIPRNFLLVGLLSLINNDWSLELV
jgi:hypothetical protein